MECFWCLSAGSEGKGSSGGKGSAVELGVLRLEAFDHVASYLRCAQAGRLVAICKEVSDCPQLKDRCTDSARSEENPMEDIPCRRYNALVATPGYQTIEEYLEDLRDWAARELPRYKLRLGSSDWA